MNAWAMCTVMLLALSLLPIPRARADGNAVHGSNIFAQQCAVCHSFKQGKNKIGPSLFAVVGRPSGSIADYRYSEAMKNSNLSWDTDTLNRYLSNPQAAIPGVKMQYPGLANSSEREDLIAFLSTLR